MHTSNYLPAIDSLSVFHQAENIIYVCEMFFLCIYGVSDKQH